MVVRLFFFNRTKPRLGFHTPLLRLGFHIPLKDKMRLTRHSHRPAHIYKVLDSDTQLYTAIVNSPFLKLNIRVVFLVHKGKRKAILFSTDTQLEATEIVRYYRSRFQIEFLFRDARQYTGLGDCQSPKKEALTFHFNANIN